jgi:hypothetical protein
MDDSFRSSILLPGFPRPNSWQHRDGVASVWIDVGGGGSAWGEAFWIVAYDVVPLFVCPLDEPW